MAIVVPDAEVLEAWARSKSIEGDIKQLCQNEVRLKKNAKKSSNIKKENKLTFFALEVDRYTCYVQPRL